MILGKWRLSCGETRAYPVLDNWKKRDPAEAGSPCKPIGASQLKEFPHPQLWVTLGFSMAKPAPIRPSL
jgi:hypothetical protein